MSSTGRVSEQTSESVGIAGVAGSSGGAACTRLFAGGSYVVLPAEASRLRVVRCPFCQADDDKVIDSRGAEHGGAIRRRRECLACAQRFTTYERVEEVVVLIRKRGGTLESFDGQKLVAGIERAASGRIDDDAVHEIVAQVEAHLRTMGPEVTSDTIGVAVLERLRALDQVAYLRFASVYKGFEDAADFARELGELDKTTAPKPR